MGDASIIPTAFLTFEVSGRTLQVYEWHVLELVMAGRQAAAAGGWGKVCFPVSIEAEEAPI